MSNCVSSGIIFYRDTEDSKDVELLVQQRVGSKSWIEDFGGKFDPGLDTCIEDTAMRETAEESNGALVPIGIKNNIKDSQDFIKTIFTNKIRVISGTYILFLVPLDRKKCDPEPSDFGDCEVENIHGPIPRIVKWVTLTNFKKLNHRQVHPRIRRFWYLF